MSLYFRSRTPGVLGVSVRFEEFGDDDTESTYRISVPGGRVLRTATGTELMLDGIGLVRRAASAASVLLITREPAAVPELK